LRGERLCEPLCSTPPTFCVARVASPLPLVATGVGPWLLIVDNAHAAPQQGKVEGRLGVLLDGALLLPLLEDLRSPTIPPQGRAARVGREVGGARIVVSLSGTRNIMLKEHIKRVGLAARIARRTGKAQTEIWLGFGTRYGPLRHARA